jgi:hypothetical protein
MQGCAVSREPAAPGLQGTPGEGSRAGSGSLAGPAGTAGGRGRGWSSTWWPCMGSPRGARAARCRVVRVPRCASPLQRSDERPPLLPMTCLRVGATKALGPSFHDLQGFGAQQGGHGGGRGQGPPLHMPHCQLHEAGEGGRHQGPGRGREGEGRQRMVVVGVVVVAGAGHQQPRRGSHAAMHRRRHAPQHPRPAPAQGQAGGGWRPAAPSYLNSFERMKIMSMSSTANRRTCGGACAGARRGGGSMRCAT